MKPVEAPTSVRMISRMPASARKDLMEWFPKLTLEQAVEEILSRQVSLADLSALVGRSTLRDDRPVNEYFALRRNAKSLKDLFCATFYR